jgi:hypothetical protein
MVRYELSKRKVVRIEARPSLSLGNASSDGLSASAYSIGLLREASGRGRNHPFALPVLISV